MGQTDQCPFEAIAKIDEHLDQVFLSHSLKNFEKNSSLKLINLTTYLDTFGIGLQKAIKNLKAGNIFIAFESGEFPQKLKKKIGLETS